MNRDTTLKQISERSTPWDLIIVGGGATGIGIAVDAASRGYDVALLEQSDFGKGTSSRSTKLIHGGVRYLQQGNVPLVMEALKERGILRNNAPHLVHELPFVVPNYRWWEAPFYGVGMKVYDALAFRYGFGPSQNLSLEETLERIPTIETEGLRGGVVYHDGQFDDARLLTHLAMTAVEQGAVLANYVRVTGLTRGEDGFLDGVEALDVETGDALHLSGRVVINATGAFSDEVRALDNAESRPMIRPSQGVHVVLPRRFLPGDSAIMVPHTDDGRILFAIPWHDCVLVGTTDTPIDSPSLEPVPFDEEVDFILEHAVRYLTEDPSREDVLSVFAGIRPLVAAGDAADTAEISREHSIVVSSTGLVTVAGGKWTTYRKMAEDAVDHAATLAGLEPAECVTKELRIHGYHTHADRFGVLGAYGSDAVEIEQLWSEHEDMRAPVHADLDLTVGEVVWFVRSEMARTVDDVLSRRSRGLVLNARAAAAAAPAVATIMSRELGWDETWAQAQVEEFQELASRYTLT